MFVLCSVGGAAIAVHIPTNLDVVRVHIKQQGSVDVLSLKSYLIGPSRVGKTTTLRRLTGEIDHLSPKGIYESLPVRIYDRTEQSSVLISEGWKSLELNEQCQALCSYILKSPAPSSKSTTTQLPSTAGTDEITAALTSLVRQKDWENIHEFLKNLDNFTLLNFVDIGGPHEMLPLLLHGLALNLIFFNMSQGLNSSYTVVYRSEDSDSSSIQDESEFTVRDIIQRALHSISSLQSNMKYNKPAAILVGTHLDKCTEADVDALEQSVKKYFANFIEDGVLCSVNKPRDLEEKRYIHPVDNVSRDPSDIESLRELITTIVHDRFKPDVVPTATLLLYLILRMKFDPTPGWCSLKECIEIAERCGISREDLLAEGGILQYLHDRFGTIFHYRGLKIGQRVIVNTNLVIRPPTELFITAFDVKTSERAIAERIRRTGEISHRLMKKVCSSSRGQSTANEIPTDEIVELLKSRYILYENAQSAHEEKVYFFPSLLYLDHEVNKESRDPSHLNSLPYPPILLIPKEGNVPLVPHGPFPATVVALSQSSHWTLAESRRFRNRFCFNFKEELDVELRSFSTHLEFRICHDASKPIDRLIEKCFSELSKFFDNVLSFHPHTQTMEREFGFYCPKESDRHPHLASYTTMDEPDSFHCSQHGELVLEDKYYCWFTVSDSQYTVMIVDA